MRKFSIYYNDGSVVNGGGEDDEEVTLTFSKKVKPLYDLAYIQKDDEEILQIVSLIVHRLA